MPSWGELLWELEPHIDENGEQIPALSFDDLRTKYISLLSQKRKKYYCILFRLVKTWKNLKY